MSIGQMLFSAKGRIRRRDFWLWSIVVYMLIYVFDFVAHVVLTDHPATQFVADLGNIGTNPFNMATVVVLFISQWSMACLNAKRWHDRNRTGYFAIIVGVLNVLPLSLGYIHPAWLEPKSVPFVGYAIVTLLITIWTFVDLGCLDGTKGPNKYGPSPKQIPAQVDVF